MKGLELLRKGAVWQGQKKCFRQSNIKCPGIRIDNDSHLSLKCKSMRVLWRSAGLEEALCLQLVDCCYAKR